MDEGGRSPLHYAAMEDDLDEVRRLIANGEDTNASDARGLTPLHFAAEYFAVRAGAELLSAGARVDSQDAFGNSPLFAAVFNCDGTNGEFIGLLRAHGADPMLPNKSGQTPVGLARLIDNYEVAQFFDDVRG